MKNNFVIKKCEKCGTTVRLLQDCEKCDILCCGEKMKTMEPNTVDAAQEKHIPTYQVYGEKMIVKVNHVMEEEHYIEWIACVNKDREFIKYLNPGDVPEVTFKHRKGSTIYAYCNKHGLWKTEVE